jgi:excisionase family DNA binding protein
MAQSFLTSLSEEELKNFIQQAVIQALSIRSAIAIGERLPDIMDIKQAAAYLKLKVNTLYEKTALRLIPHSKKGGKLLFVKDELLAWVKAGKVNTLQELEFQALIHDNKKNRRG